jgi:hypothetical protein
MKIAFAKPTHRRTVRREGPGFLEIYSAPTGEAPVLHVSGTPEEMGRQYGALVGDRIRRNIDRMVGLFTGMGVPGAVVHLILDKAWEHLAPHTPERYLREIAAIADGARAAGFDLTATDIQRLTAVTNFDLYKREERVMELFGADIAALLGSSGETEPMSCTMFAVWGARTVDGKLLAHRNLDWVSQTGMHADRLVTVYRPAGRHAFVTMDYAGVIGALAGMNARGIAFSEIGAFSAREELDGTPWILIARRVLEDADCLEDGVAIVEQAQHTIGYNYMVADGDPDHFGTPAFRPRAAVFETNCECCETFFENDPKEHAASWTDPEGRVIKYGLPLKQAVARGDMAFGARARALQATDNGPGDPANDGDPLKGATYIECHKPMYDMIRAYETGAEYVYPLRGTKVIEAGAPKKIGPEEAMTIAATVAHNTEKLAESDWNVMSVVYAPTDLDFWVAYETCDAAGNWENAPDSGYVQFNLKALLDPGP